jgi:hypothetical protein
VLGTAVSCSGDAWNELCFVICIVLYCEELHNLYSSPTIVRVIKPRRIIWAGRVSRIGDGRGVCRVEVWGGG